MRSLLVVNSKRVWKHILSLSDEHQVAAQPALAADRLRRARYRAHYESSFSDLAAEKFLGLDFWSKVIERYEKLGGELEGYFAIRLWAWSVLRESKGLRFAIRYPGSGELLDSLQKVRYELSLSA